jgi:hypothetical protein
MRPQPSSRSLWGRYLSSTVYLVPPVRALVLLASIAPPEPWFPIRDDDLSRSLCSYGPMVPRNVACYTPHATPFMHPFASAIRMPSLPRQIMRLQRLWLSSSSSKESYKNKTASIMPPRWTGRRLRMNVELKIRPVHETRVSGVRSWRHPLSTLADGDLPSYN